MVWETLHAGFQRIVQELARYVAVKCRLQAAYLLCRIAPLIELQLVIISFQMDDCITWRWKLCKCRRCAVCNCTQQDMCHRKSHKLVSFATGRCYYRKQWKWHFSHPKWVANELPKETRHTSPVVRGMDSSSIVVTWRGTNVSTRSVQNPWKN